TTDVLDLKAPEFGYMATMIVAVVMLAAFSAVELERSCGAGKAAACEELGNRLQEGLGVRRDEARAAQLFRKACRAKSADGCADDARSLALHACDLGDPSGCSYLGDTYARSNDTVRAILFFRRACEGGFAHGCAGQGYLLLNSGADPKKARELLQAGCAGGDENACHAVRDLK